MEKSLFVGGVVSLTTLDYPGHLSTVVFLQGCPWRCVYCHNRHLQSILPTESLPWEDILNLLEIRRGFVEAVVFSGGEPLMQERLLNAIEDVRAMGFKVGLHTSGAFPDRFKCVLPSVDWVGFDVKCSFNDYQKVTNIKDSGIVALESLNILIASKVDYEVRITVFEEMDISAIVEVLKEISTLGVKTVVLQKCRDKGESVVEHAIFSDKLLLEDISKYFDSFHVRG
ncbi:MAG: anaerobic ribonucleoside-triphosphate reductase activating protein [Holosporaceae bacterium]|nr:anaerobic ribonucleoside-triphosphate reductase activating protein [Holosporaceae bacterium]